MQSRLAPLLAALALALPAAAQARPGGPPDPLMRLERGLDALDLDAATESAIQAKLDASREENKASAERLRALRGEMRELLESDAPSEAQVLAKAEEIGAAETQLRQASLKTLLAVRAMLTPEQRARLLAQREGGRRDRFAGRAESPGDGAW